MNINPTDIYKEQIPVIRKMIEDECWYEGERRKSQVNPTDPAIILKVGQIVMEHGARMRLEAMARIMERENK